MNRVLAVISKEFSGYFKNYTAYIILGVYLLLSYTMMFYSAHFFDFDNRSLMSFFAYQPEILNILLPAVTMKMWAEEHRLGTLEFLLTQPVKLSVFVWGKFLAAFSFGLFLLLLTIPFVIYNAQLVDYDMLNLISAYLGVILTMSALCALGCMVSAFNNNVILAYLSSVFCGWLWENVNFDILCLPLKPIFPLAVSRLSGVLDFSSHYQTLVQGQLGIVNLIYFISVAAFAVWLNMLAVATRKS